VTAYEADPALFAMLAATGSNGAGDVEAVHAALWTSAGTIAFQCEGSDSGMIGSLPGAIDGRPVTVPACAARPPRARAVRPVETRHRGCRRRGARGLRIRSASRQGDGDGSARIRSARAAGAARARSADARRLLVRD
jgi:hypothetical protein